MGLLVCFSGMDGTGKTTLAKSVVEILTERGWNTVQIWTPNFLFIKYPIGILRHIRRGANNDCRNPLLTRGTKSGLLRLFPYLALIDIWTFYLVQIKSNLIRGRAVVCDRYFYNFFLSFEYYGYSSHQTTAFCTQHIPRPDLSFVLDCEPELAHKRENNGSHDLAFFQAQRVHYQRMARRLHFELIDTNQVLEKTSEQIRGRLNEYLHNRR